MDRQGKKQSSREKREISPAEMEGNEQHGAMICREATNAAGGGKTIEPESKCIVERVQHNSRITSGAGLASIDGQNHG